MRHPRTSDPSGTAPTSADATPMLRIQEVGALVGLTPRSIRYYEEMGLLSPSARSQGAYRLFDALDVERLRFIKGLRDDAGFSIAEIRHLLEDEAARRLAREAFAATEDPDERRRILAGRLASYEEQLDHLRAKRDRLDGMIREIEGRRDHVSAHLRDLGR
jgi:DNA-binding transcriptional MerR regulator